MASMIFLFVEVLAFGESSPGAEVPAFGRSSADESRLEEEMIAGAEVPAFGRSSADESRSEEEMILLQLRRAAAKEVRAGTDGHGGVVAGGKSGRYKGIIFPHVSKVGGNSVRAFAAAIADALGAPLLNPEAGEDLGRLAAPENVIFLQDNYGHILNDDEKRDFFVIGTYRNPCDTALSHWAYVSKRESIGDWHHVPNDYTAWKAEWNRVGGIVAPYDDAQSRIHFKRYVMESGLFFDEEQRMRAKYDTTGRIEDAASCWMNLYHLQDDLRTCLTSYLQQQNIQDVDVSAVINREVVHEGVDDANPSPHPRCSTMFDSEMINHVSSLNQDIMQAFNLTCCST